MKDKENFWLVNVNLPKNGYSFMVRFECDDEWEVHDELLKKENEFLFRFPKDVSFFDVVKATDYDYDYFKKEGIIDLDA